MVIALGSDHAGFKYKEAIKEHLSKQGHEVLDEGTFSCDSCDYPVYGKKAALSVSIGKADFGVLVCSSGEGIMIAANKITGIRCGIGYNDDVSRLLRQHNNANMISFGASFMELGDILRRIDIFLSTEFEGGRHLRRVHLIDY